MNLWDGIAAGLVSGLITGAAAWGALRVHVQWLHTTAKRHDSWLNKLQDAINDIRERLPIKETR